LQPGAILKFLQRTSVFRHDCSTLGGNSGSCVVDLNTHRVLGLHFGGYYLRYNQAVALWAIKDDPIIRRAKLNFE
jgi:V8-like Glu-specific endopeptidase